MKTHIDGQILRPYFNSGYLIVRPEQELLKEWWNTYKKVYTKPAFKEFYQKDELYSIYVHQAILSAVIIKVMKKNEMNELPFEYNYPLNLYEESLEEFKPKNISDMVTVRYYLEKLKDSKALERIPMEEPLKSWIRKKLREI